MPTKEYTENKKRFFTDDLESSVDNSSILDLSLDKKDSILFGNASDHSNLNIENDADTKVQVDKEFEEFQLILSGMLPDITDTMIRNLYDRFKDHDNIYNAAVEYYFDKNKPLADQSKSELLVESDEEHNKLKDVEVIEDYREETPQISIGNESSPLSSRPSSTPKRKKLYGFRESKRLKNSITWKRFIGALQVSGMLTRPMLKPLKYGTNFKLVKDIPKNQNGKIYNSSGKKNVAMSSLVKIYDVQTNREVGKLSEDISELLFHLLGKDEFIFDLTLVYSEPRRLRIGDTIILQLDIFLTSTLFEENNETETTRGQFGISSQKILETSEEIELKEFRNSIIKLFEKLNVTQVVDKREMMNEAGIIEESLSQVIDLDYDLDDDQKDKPEIVIDEDIAEPQHPSDSELNINQINAFYKVVQSDGSIMNIPVTTPDTSKFKLTLRKYQKQGLTWMLKREQEFEKLDKNIKLEEQVEVTNPFWKQYKWPKDMSWVRQRLEPTDELKNDSMCFYSNLYTGKFSIKKPSMISTLKGGILADEMGLGKTISTLALIMTVPFDEEVTFRQLNETLPSQNSLNSNSQNNSLPYASKTTLIVVPMSLLTQWFEEFNKVNGTDNLTCEIYYGGNVSSLKTFLTKTSSPPAVVLTTYGIVQSEWSKLGKYSTTSNRQEDGSGLFSVKFFRIILDEGHTIRNRSTATSKSILNLSGNRKWILTGTPIINRIDDLYNLIKFLRLEPWSQVSFWKNFITKPFEQKNFKKTFDVVNSILEPVCLRRTKQMKDSNGKPLVELPSKEVVLEKLKLNDTQESVYKYFLKNAETSVQNGIQQGDLLKKYSTILVHILRLRQACCDIKLLGLADDSEEDLINNTLQLHDSVSIKKDIENISKSAVSKTLQSVDVQSITKKILSKYIKNGKFIDTECFICIQEPINTSCAIFTECGHCFCKECLISYIQFQKEKHSELKCPNCRTTINENILFKLDTNCIDDIKVIPYNEYSRPAKLEALLHHLEILALKSPGEQIVVFSQFSSYLDILERELLELLPSNTTEIFKFDGRLSLKERSDVLKQFRVKNLGKQKILLLSLKAGGVGLNLTCSSYAFMMDPWWSPSMEDQAIDRIHRIGQKNPVKIIKFIISNSVEEKMLRIQERKRTIGEAMDVDEESRRQRRIDEIQMLFE